MDEEYDSKDSKCFEYMGKMAASMKCLREVSYWYLERVDNEAEKRISISFAVSY